MARRIIASVFGAGVIASIACGVGGSSDRVAPVQPASASSASTSPPSAPFSASRTIVTPESVYKAIAQATIPTTATDAELATREASVKQFIGSNGGDVMYRNYIKEYGLPPDTREWYIASPADPTTSKLGYYYLTHPLTSGPDVVLFDCTKSTTMLPTDPTLQGLCGLSQWDAYQMTGNETYARDMLKTADGFVAEAVNGRIQWQAPMVPSFGITKAPWISALTQSVAISTLLRAFQYTGASKYKDAATAAFHWLTVPVSQGGLQSSDIGTWLEEYPTQNPTVTNGHVFNGNIWALFGVWDYYRVTGSTTAKALFDADVQAVKGNMTWFDLGYWNVYSHQDRISTVHGLYMQFIVQQMYALAAITNDPYFRSLGEKWERAQATDALFVHNMARTYLSANP